MSAHPGKTCVGYVWGDYKGCEVQLFPVRDILYYSFQKWTVPADR